MNRINIPPHDPPASRLISMAAKELQRGSIVAYPTDTFYALGCSLESIQSAKALYQTKNMKKSKRLSLICPDLATAAIYAHFSQTAFQTARRVFPGPFTMLLPASREIPRLLMDKRRRTVGIRIVNHPVTTALVKALARPLLTTTAIDKNGVPCTDADDVTDQSHGSLQLLIDSGATPGEQSTILSFDGDTIEIVRQGLGKL